MRNLDFIRQFTTDLHHIQGSSNTAADTLSHLEINAHHTGNTSVVDFRELALAQVEDPELPRLQADSSLQLESIPFLSDGISLNCDISTGVQCPYVPQSLRRTIFNFLHSFSHPGIRATQHLVTSRYVWPNINSDVRNWARSCLQCQQTKVHRHIATPLGTLTTPDARFHHVHIDLVGPLPSSNGCIHLLTCINRFTRWPEAVPISEGSAVTVAKAFIQIWVSRFRVPATITTDHGGQFESNLWKAATQLLGTKHIRTTAYHPIANGMMERFHRQLKSSLKASPHPERWTNMLNLALLGIRTTLKEDLKFTTAELVYGTSLRLPGEFFITQDVTDLDKASYTTQLKDSMRTLRCTLSRHSFGSTRHTSDALISASHVFVHHDAVKKPLQQPYDGPYCVLNRSDRFYTIDRNGHTDSVSIDRLKPAYVNFPTNGTPSLLSPTATSPSQSTQSTDPVAQKPMLHSPDDICTGQHIFGISLPSGLLEGE